ncbi:hypothetical protein A2U01_0116363, partial [Trifolium medium]|nr:hypothetical protein [Trifolium medium]
SESGEFGLCVVWISDVALDVFDWVISIQGGSWPPCNAVDLPPSTRCACQR